MGSRGNSAADETANEFTAADFGFTGGGDNEDGGDQESNLDIRYLPRPADAMDHIGI